MDPNVKSPMTAFAFGEFKFSISTQDLRRNGDSIRLQMQPAKVLQVLLTHAGETVTREDLRRQVWSEGIHVDFDDALNHSIKYLRDALGDNAAMPRYIETIPRRGYRFVCAVEKVAEVSPVVTDTRPPQASDGGLLPGAAMPQRHNAVWAFIAVAAIALAIGTWWNFAEASAPRVMNVAKVTHFGLAYAVVTDGVRLYVEREQGGHHTLVTLPADGSSEPVALPTPFRNTSLFDISPDGRELLIASYDVAGDPTGLWRLPLAGGSPHRVGNVLAFSAKWSPDGRWIAFTGHSDGDGKENALYLTNGEGSEPQRITERSGQIDSWSPDGKWLRFTRTNDSTGGMMMWEVAFDGRSTARTFLPERVNAAARWGEGQCCGRPIDEGKYFLFREGTGSKIALWALPSGKHWFGDSPALEVYSAGFDIDDHAAPSLAPNGHRLYFVGRNQGQELMRFDKRRDQFVPYLPDLSARFFSWSPGGKWVAYCSGPQSVLYRAKADGSERLQLTYPPMQVFAPRWSPDGKRLVFHTLSPGQPGKIALISAEGGKVEVVAPEQTTAEDSHTWSPDGYSVLFSRTSFDSTSAVQSRTIWMIDLRTQKETKLPGSDGYLSPAWSPDGRYAAAQTDDGRDLVIFDFQTQKWRKLASGVSLQPPFWSHDSSSIYYQDWLVTEEQPIYRVTLASGTAVKIAGRDKILRSDVARYQLVGLTFRDEPVARVVHNNADVYALDLELP